MVFCLLCGRSREADRSIHLYRVPKDDDLRKQWIKAVGRYLPVTSYVCSRHFPKGSIGFRKLLKNATPRPVSIPPKKPRESIEVKEEDVYLGIPELEIVPTMEDCIPEREDCIPEREDCIPEKEDCIPEKKDCTSNKEDYADEVTLRLSYLERKYESLSKKYETQLEVNEQLRSELYQLKLQVFHEVKNRKQKRVRNEVFVIGKPFEEEEAEGIEVVIKTEPHWDS